MSYVPRKPVFGVSDQVRHKLGCTVTEDGWRLAISVSRKKRDCTIYITKTKALISSRVVGQLIFAFVSAMQTEAGFLMTMVIDVMFR